MKVLKITASRRTINLSPSRTFTRIVIVGPSNSDSTATSADSSPWSPNGARAVAKRPGQLHEGGGDRALSEPPVADGIDQVRQSGDPGFRGRAFGQQTVQQRIERLLRP